MSTYRFGEFQFNAATGDLQGPESSGRVRPQAATVLTLLLDARGEFVSRSRIAAALWNGETHVDENAGINFTVRELREQLGDEASAPRYIASAPKRGYRLLTPVEIVGAPPATMPSRRRFTPGRVAAFAAAVGAVAWLAWASVGTSRIQRILVEVNADPDASKLVNVLPLRDAAIDRLTAPPAAARLGVVSPFDGNAGGSVAALRERHVDWLLHAAVQHVQGRLVVHAKLVRIDDNRVVWSLNREVEPAQFGETYRLLAAEMAAAALRLAHFPIASS